jgi:hypothetical protein
METRRELGCQQIVRQFRSSNVAEFLTSSNSHCCLCHAFVSHKIKLGIAQRDLAVVPMDRKLPLGDHFKTPPEKWCRSNVFKRVHVSNDVSHTHTVEAVLVVTASSELPDLSGLHARYVSTGTRSEQNVNISCGCGSILTVAAAEPTTGTIHMETPVLYPTASTDVESGSQEQDVTPTWFLSARNITSPPGFDVPRASIHWQAAAS